MAQHLVATPGTVNVSRKRSTLHDDQESCKVVDPTLRGSNFHSSCTARRCWSGPSFGDLGSAVRRATPELISEIVRIMAHEPKKMEERTFQDGAW